MFDKTLPQRTGIGMAAALFCLALFGCSNEQEIALKPTAALPAAEGTATVWADNLDETVVEIDARYLVSPGETKDPLYYIAWAKDGDTTAKLGTLKLEDGEAGKLVSSTHLKNFTIEITAEEEPSPEKPTEDPILVSASSVHANTLT